MAGTKKNTNSQKPDSANKVTRKVPDIPSASKSDFPIVGIGASAGGLEAYEIFFRNMPSDAGVAFVLVSHLSPRHKSMLPEILQKYTKMRVSEILDGIHIQPNNIYIIPPGKEVAIINGSLQLLDAAKKGLKHPIDTFFNSLAEDQHEKSICIILSGTGTDGSAALKAIKEKGGMIMVQSPETTQYDGMPRSAISTGLTDYIIPVEEMPKNLIGYLKRYKVVSTQVSQPKNALQKIFLIIRRKTGHDFSEYKLSTITRRIEHRMGINSLDNYEEYIALLQSSDKEIDFLFNEFLINVTSFFRDAEAFVHLKKSVLPELFSNTTKVTGLRIWVAGCATGEEAYSLAIIIREFMAEHEINMRVQIFATDIDEDVIKIARQGIYPNIIANDVSPERLKTFFTGQGLTYQVKREVRDMVIFANHNLTKDPPFSRMDLITCRNLLIYFNSDLQPRIIRMFHYVLKLEGYLFLGASETVGQLSEYFTPSSKKWKVFIAKNKALSEPKDIKTTKFSADPSLVLPDKKLSQRKVNRIEALFHSYLRQTFVPPSVLINSIGDVLYLHGKTGIFLQPSEGEASFNIYSMALPEFRLQLENAVRKCQFQKRTVIAENIPVSSIGKNMFLKLTVRQTRENKDDNVYYLISFEAAERIITSKDLPDKKRQGSVKDSEYIDLLENDLKITQENLRVMNEELESSNEELQTTNEELQSTNEELQSANEELQSANEELQSSNEELETSKEELQSLNEELISVNAELQNKIDELTDSRNDIINLFDSTDIATVFLDYELRIKRFTPKATDIINLLDKDEGRPISHLSSNLDYDNLIDDLNKVRRSLKPISKNVHTFDSHAYEMRIRPYRTMDNFIDGVILTFIDVEKQNRLQQQIARQQQFLDSIYKQKEVGFYIFEITHKDQFTLLSTTPFADPITGLKDDKNWGEGKLDRSNITKLFEVFHKDKMLDCINKNQAIQYEVNESTSEKNKWLQIRLEPLQNESTKNKQVIATSISITDRKDLELNVQLFYDAFKNSNDAIVISDLNGIIIFANSAAEIMFDPNNDSAIVGKHRSEFRKSNQHLLQLNAEKSNSTIDDEFIRVDGQLFIGSVNSSFITVNDQKRIGVIEIIRDITDHKLAEQRLELSEYKFRTIFEHALNSKCIVSEDGSFIVTNKALNSLLGYDRVEIKKYSLSQLQDEDELQTERALTSRFFEKISNTSIVETRLKQKSGEVIWVNLKIVAFVFPDDIGQRFLVTIEDISRYRSSILANAESDEITKAIFENSPEGIVYMDNNGFIIRANAVFQKLMGKSAKRKMQKRFNELFVDIDQSRVDLVLSSLKDNSFRSANFGSKLPITKNTQRDVKVSIYGIYDNANNLQAIVAILDFKHKADGILLL